MNSILENGRSAIEKRGRLIAVAAVSGMSGLFSTSTANAGTLYAEGPETVSTPIISSLVPGGGNGGVQTNVVSPGSTFSIAIVGFNGTTSTAAGAYLTTPSVFDPTFGTTTTYAGDALGGQTLTITSSEVIGVSTTVDTITMSVPTNFAPTGTTIGTRYIAAIDLDIGGYNATPAVPLSYVVAPVSPVASGFITYSGGNFALSPLATAENGGLAYEAAEGVSSGTGASQANSVEPLDVNVISFSLTYPTVAVPEPTSIAGLGVACAALLVRRRRVIA